MPKKKAKQPPAADGEVQTPPPATLSTPATDPRSSALVIARNKHWRYISNYHGPWLQLPTEVLETIAHTNYYAPRPHPIDPAIVFDLLKIRKAVDEATDLAVRAASGVSSAQLQSSVSTSNGVLNGAAALGLTFGNNGPTTKLSRERKHRMRELATQKLSQAYHLDEIAASVAMMQSTSTLEDLASLVLQRNEYERDARYVNFFHEKIPSRMMAEFTPLTMLNHLIRERPNDLSPYRTRALTKVFKDDLPGAAKDLTEALALAKLAQGPRHGAGKSEIAPRGYVDSDGHYRSRDWKNETKLEEKDHPSSLEAQLLFHRANIYMRMSCQQIHQALDAWKLVQSAAASFENAQQSSNEIETKATQQRHLDYRKIVKANARKALRDYLGFLEHLEYTPGLSSEESDDNSTVGSPKVGQEPVNGSEQARRPENKRSTSNLLAMKYPKVYTASDLFSASLPAGLPPYPPQSSTELVVRSKVQSEPPSPKLSDYQMERVTYHPLLTEALHSILLCHALVQTPPTELRRHAMNAARLIRLLSGFPVFLHARSTSRADWNEVLRLTNDWIDLKQEWILLCRSRARSSHADEHEADAASLANIASNRNLQSLSPKQKKEAVVQRAMLEALADEKLEETNSVTLANYGSKQNFKSLNPKQKKEVIVNKAIREALVDESVVDEETFHKAVQRRESAFEQQEAAATIGAEYGDSQDPHIPAVNSLRTVVKNDPTIEFPGFSTERAEAISRWILEAPLTVEGAKSKKGKKKAKKRSPLEDSVEKLSLAGSPLSLNGDAD